MQPGGFPGIDAPSVGRSFYGPGTPWRMPLEAAFLARLASPPGSRLSPLPGALEGLRCSAVPGRPPAGHQGVPGGRRRARRAWEGLCVRSELPRMAARDRSALSLLSQANRQS